MSKQSHANPQVNNSIVIRPLHFDASRAGWRQINKNRMRRILSISVVSVLAACILLSVVARVHNNADAKSVISAERLNTTDSSNNALAVVGPSPRIDPASTSGTLTDDTLEVANIVLTRFGFEPNSITRSSTKFLLSVENRSPVGAIELHLDRVAGLRVHQQQVATERPEWRDFFTLEPGDYVLSEAGHPDWICNIKITAR